VFFSTTMSRRARPAIQRIVELPASIQDSLRDEIKQFKITRAGINFVPAAIAGLTLVFPGSLAIPRGSLRLLVGAFWMRRFRVCA